MEEWFTILKSDKSSVLLLLKHMDIMYKTFIDAWNIDWHLVMCFHADTVDCQLPIVVDTKYKIYTAECHWGKSP